MTGPDRIARRQLVARRASGGNSTNAPPALAPMKAAQSAAGTPSPTAHWPRQLSRLRWRAASLATTLTSDSPCFATHSPRARPWSSSSSRTSPPAIGASPVCCAPAIRRQLLSGRYCVRASNQTVTPLPSRALTRSTTRELGVFAKRTHFVWNGLTLPNTGHSPMVGRETQANGTVLNDAAPKRYHAKGERGAVPIKATDSEFLQDSQRCLLRLCATQSSPTAGRILGIASPTRSRPIPRKSSGAPR